MKLMLICLLACALALGTAYGAQDGSSPAGDVLGSERDWASFRVDSSRGETNILPVMVVAAVAVAVATGQRGCGDAHMNGSLPDGIFDGGVPSCR